MKRLFAVVLLLSCLPLFAATVDNTITFSDHTGSPQAVKRVVVTPLTWGLYNGTNIALAIPITKQTDASGSVTVSNLASGYSYRVQLFNAQMMELGRFTNSFGTNVSGAVFARDYLTISTNLAGGTTAYSRDAADARFARTVVESTSNALTSGVLYIKTNYSGGGSYNGNGGGLTNLQSTNIVFQDYDWLSNPNNADDGGEMILKNSYQRHTYVNTTGEGTFGIFAVTSPSGKPSWSSLKIYNNSGATMQLSVGVPNARPIGSGTPANGVNVSVPNGKVAWITIHDDGQGTDWSVTYAVAIEP